MVAEYGVAGSRPVTRRTWRCSHSRAPRPAPDAGHGDSPFSHLFTRQVRNPPVSSIQSDITRHLPSTLCLLA